MTDSLTIWGTDYTGVKGFKAGAHSDGPAGKNLYNPATKTDGYFLNSSGVLTEESTCSISDYIAVVPGENYVWSGVSGKTGSNNKRVVGYTTAKAYSQVIKAVSVTGIDIPYENSFTVPTGVYFVRLSYNTADSELMIEHGSIKTSYEPYTNIVNYAYIRPQGTKSITQNGTGIDVAEYATVDVSVSGGINIPTFTVTLASDGETVVSVTCDKTFAECGDYLSNNIDSAILNTVITGGDTFNESVTNTEWTPGSKITYTSGIWADIVYTPNSLTYVVPSWLAETLTVTENGTYYPDAGAFTEVNVNVSGGGGNVFIITVSKNSQTGYWEPNCTWADLAAAYSGGKTIVMKSNNSGANPTVECNLSYMPLYLLYVVDEEQDTEGSAVEDYWIIEGVYQFDSNGLTPPSETYIYWETNQADATASDLLSGKIAYGQNGRITGSATARTSSDLSVSGNTVTAPAGFYSSSASASVANGTAGTPTATKGTVSNHAITVTPSVTNTTGYISGGTISGTGVSVAASELVSGTLSITENGSGIDVTNYAAVDVSISGGGVIVTETQDEHGGTIVNITSGTTVTLQ